MGSGGHLDVEARYSCAFNLFRRKQDPHLCCTVPEDKAVPPFVGPNWEFAVKVTSPGEAPPGFRERGAWTGVRFNGYYVFQKR
jgi:hypothetical protein